MMRGSRASGLGFQGWNPGASLITTCSSLFPDVRKIKTLPKTARLGKVCKRGDWFWA